MRCDDIMVFETKGIRYVPNVTEGKGKFISASRLLLVKYFSIAMTAILGHTCT
jgi:hypothetical protein